MTIEELIRELVREELAAQGILSKEELTELIDERFAELAAAQRLRPFSEHLEDLKALVFEAEKATGAG